ncbi:MAG: hypothetical protein FJX76_14815 [Armatimonadetes bacterium]|nr:hypothetical protein [Armatimonadota bacterium]
MHSLHADVLERLGRMPAALEAMRAAVECTPYEVGLRWKRARMLVKSGQAGRALGEARAALLLERWTATPTRIAASAATALLPRFDLTRVKALAYNHLRPQPNRGHPFVRNLHMGL